MARVGSFKSTGKSIKPQPSSVECGYAFNGQEGRATLIQIETYGSEGRRNPGVVSQSFQLTREAAHQLWLLLGRGFGFDSE